MQAGGRLAHARSKKAGVTPGAREGKFSPAGYCDPRQVQLHTSEAPSFLVVVIFLTILILKLIVT